MSMSIRQAYGEYLAELGREQERIVVLDADVSSSTQSKFFAAAHPERFFNMGIAEVNMTATAAGLARQGFVPFVNTFAVFITSMGYVPTRALACYGDLDVKLAGAYCGVSDAFDGASHHATEDMAIMRALPNMRILCPADVQATRALTRLCAETHGPCYLRLSRDSFPDIYESAAEFSIGGANILSAGEDLVIFACGSMVHAALEAAETLREKGVSAAVVDLYSIKPLNEELVLDMVSRTGAVVTAEQHNVIGGLGSAVAETLFRGGVAAAAEMVGIQDCFTESGPYAALQAKYGLDAGAIVKAALRVMAKKGN